VGMKLTWKNLLMQTLCIFCLLSPLGIAQEAFLGTEDDARALAEAAMEHIGTGEFESAFERLRPHWPFPMVEFENLLQTTLSQRANVESRFGSSLGYEFVESETVSDFLLRLTYAEKTERHVLRWRFRFYKPEDRWILSSIEWDDNVDALLRD
jgi:hypothetical protein